MVGAHVSCATTAASKRENRASCAGYCTSCRASSASGAALSLLRAVTKSGCSVSTSTVPTRSARSTISPGPIVIASPTTSAVTGSVSGLRIRRLVVPAVPSGNSMGPSFETDTRVRAHETDRRAFSGVRPAQGADAATAGRASIAMHTSDCAIRLPIHRDDMRRDPRTFTSGPPRRSLWSGPP